MLLSEGNSLCVYIYIYFLFFSIFHCRVLNTKAEHSRNRNVWKGTQKIRLYCEAKIQTNKSEFKQQNNRKINFIWFNLPLSKIVSAKIGRYFPESHKFHSIFNRNNVKVNNSWTKNIKSIITDGNKTVLNKSETSNKKKCKCINKDPCPLSRECQAENIIYQASLNSSKLNYEEKYHKAVVKPLLKNVFQIMKNQLRTTNIKTKENFQRNYGILSQQITTQ